MGFKRFSARTVEAYIHWIRRFIVWSGKRHPKEMGAAEVNSFLGHLALEERVAASTQNQALNAVVFMYRQVVGRELQELGEFERAARPERMPVVLSREEVRALLAKLEGTQQLIGRFLYGTGLRLLEGLRVRVKDLDFARGQVIVRGGKGDKDRVTMLPESLKESLRAQLHRARELHEQDLAAGFGEVWLPGALRAKWPRADREWAWQWVFPSAELSVDRRSDDGLAREDARPTGRGVSSFRFKVSSCRWWSVEWGECEIRRTKSEGRRKSDDRWPKGEP